MAAPIYAATPLERFAGCRLRAAKQWPYAAPAISATTIVERKGCGGIVADRYWRLYFDPDVVNEWTQAQIIGKILFEVSHLLRSHYKRFARQLGFNPAKTIPFPPSMEGKRKAWVLAAQLELIDDFDKEGLELPSAHRAEEFEFPEFLLAEHYYARLQNGEGGKGGSGGSPSPEQEQQEGQPPPPEFPVDGSAADGCPKSWEEPPPADEALPGETPGLSESEAEMMRRMVAKRVLDHAKQKGNTPLGMRRWAENVAQPKLDYKRIILSKIHKALLIVRGNRNFSYRRPNRRGLQGSGIIQPSLIDHAVNLAVVIDTSGSMNEKQLGEAIKIVAGVLKAMPRRESVRVMAADAACYKVQSIFNEMKIELDGGGGTDMTGAIVTASQFKPKPDLVLLLTDGFTSYPDGPTDDVPCCAIIVSEGEASAPDWIDQVKVPSVCSNTEDENDCG